MVNIGGSSEYSQQFFVGGKVTDEVSMILSLVGGDAGGVTSPRSGTGPGEQTGMCLFGTATGVPRVEVFSVRCGGGVEERAGMDGALATTAAMAGGGGCQVCVQLKARNVSWIDVVGKDVWLDRALGWGRANGVGLPKTAYWAGYGHATDCMVRSDGKCGVPMSRKGGVTRAAAVSSD